MKGEALVSGCMYKVAGRGRREIRPGGRGCAAKAVKQETAGGGGTVDALRSPNRSRKTKRSANDRPPAEPMRKRSHNPAACEAKKETTDHSPS